MTQFKPAILEYIEFLSLSKYKRKEKFGYAKHKEFAEQHNIHVQTLYDWKKREGFQEKLEETKKKFEERPEEKIKTIFRKLEDDAARGDKKSIEIYMKNLDIIKETLHSEIPTWEELLDKIDMIENDIKFRKKKYIT